MAIFREMRVLLAEADYQMVDWFRAAFMRLGTDLVGWTDSGHGVISMTRAHCPDVLLMSLTIAGLDGITTLEQLKQLRTGRMPAVIVMAVTGFDAFSARARALGACAAMIKPVREQDLGEVLAGLTPHDRLCPACAGESRIHQILTGLRVPVHLKGYQYLSEAIWLAARDSRLVRSLNTELYPAVARRFGTAGNLVERSIRSAIEVAWSMGDIDSQYAFFGNTIDAGRGKPTNSEFIARVAEELRMGES